MDERRSRETRARAELALVRLLHALGGEDVFLVVLGGLVPRSCRWRGFSCRSTSAPPMSMFSSSPTLT